MLIRSAEKLLHGWMLRRYLRDGDTDLRVIVDLAASLGLHAEGEKIKAALRDGTIKLPKRKVLCTTTHKLTCIDLLWQRELHAEFNFSRHWMIDSSPQKPYNFLPFLERRFGWDKRLSPAECIELDLTQIHEFRHKPLTTLGYGTEGSLYKGCNCMHASLVESGRKYQDKERNEVYTWETDQGADVEVADMAMVDPDCLGDVDGVMTAVAENKATLQSPEVASAFFLPKALRFTDLLHLLYNPFKAAAEKLPEYKQLEGHWKSIALFFGDRGLRMRYVMLCVKGSATSFGYEAVVREWKVHHNFDWKWEYVDKFARSLDAIYSDTARLFDPDKLRFSGADEQDGDKEAMAVSNNLITRVAAALKWHLLHGFTKLFVLVAWAVRLNASWLEGCWCHDWILENGHGSYYDRLRRYRKASHDCIWKGCRMVDLVCGGVDRMCNQVTHASTKAWRDFLVACDDWQRGILLQRETSLKFNIVENWRQKLDYVHHIPYKFLGALGHLYSRWTLEQSKRCVRECLHERDAALRQEAFLHRVSVRLSVTDGPIKTDLEAFPLCQGALGKAAHWDLLQYALGKVITRRVEADHSHIKMWQRKIRHFSVALCHNMLISSELLANLRTQSFWLFAIKKLRSRGLLLQVLREVLPHDSVWQLRLLSTRQLQGALFLYSPEAQHRNLNQSSWRRKQFEKMVAPTISSMPLQLELPISQMLTMLQSKLDTKGSVWSVPTVFVIFFVLSIYTRLICFRIRLLSLLMLLNVGFYVSSFATLH